MLQAATCQMAGICGECGLSPLTLDATTSKLRNFGPGVTAYMCFVNAAVDDFTIDVMGESVTGACSFRGSMNSDGGLHVLQPLFCRRAAQCPGRPSADAVLV